MDKRKEAHVRKKTKEMIGGKSDAQLNELYKDLSDLRAMMDRFAFRLKLAASHYL